MGTVPLDMHGGLSPLLGCGYVPGTVPRAIGTGDSPQFLARGSHWPKRLVTGGPMVELAGD
jgi:hypothetical protein